MPIQLICPLLAYKILKLLKHIEEPTWKKKILYITIKKRKKEDDINGPQLRIIKCSREPTSLSQEGKSHSFTILSPNLSHYPWIRTFTIKFLSLVLVYLTTKNPFIHKQNFDLGRKIKSLKCGLFFSFYFLFYFEKPLINKQNIVLLYFCEFSYINILLINDFFQLNSTIYIQQHWLSQ